MTLHARGRVRTTGNLSSERKMHVKGNYSQWLSMLIKDIWMGSVNQSHLSKFWRDPAEYEFTRWEGPSTHQPKYDEEDLDDVSIGDRNESSKESVTQGYNCWHDDRNLLIKVQYNLQCGPCSIHYMTNMRWWVVSPRAPRMEALQNISEMAAGRAWRAPHLPYFWVKGSIMVTYSAFLMGRAKNVPP